jgi:hypothetical protein
MADPRFWFGPARVLDLFGQFDQYNMSPTPQEADARALRSDWMIIGDHLVDAMERAPVEPDPEPASTK